ncbi:MAG TPA: DUF1622 domain-containing protein [Oligoflexus sp.]|uniref:DUF1622 domain-containing protein n=1 Tax=Oligoflexus sp. TaxID=1971216 RepID=UPI002D46C0D7|nr:DUF1622 domain-containing protein [Oligoflexus sp.]HYX32339.1 DUF1622 domain-containing protein [Oligoflexus sp.]
MIEDILRQSVSILTSLTEAGALIIIFVGVLRGFILFLWHSFKRQGAEYYIPIRLDLGRYLALGLEFQLASDLLRTAVAPSFEEIGKLAAVATIRTALNYFLSREIQDERQEMKMDHA